MAGVSGKSRVGSGVAGVALDRAAGLVYVSRPYHRRVQVLRANDLRLLGAVGDASFVGLRGLAVDSELRRVYVARSHHADGAGLDALTVIQRHTTGRHSIDRTVPLAGGVRPEHVAIDHGTGVVIVTGRHHRATTLVVLDRLTLDELNRTTVDTAPLPIAGE